MAYTYRPRTRTTYRRKPTARRMSAATRRATEAAFKRGVKSGMRKRGSYSRRSYFYR